MEFLKHIFFVLKNKDNVENVFGSFFCYEKHIKMKL